MNNENENNDKRDVKNENNENENNDKRDFKKEHNDKREKKDKKFIGDEFEESLEGEEDNLENLYDLVIPPGMPHKIIIDARDRFNLEVTTRKCALQTIDIEKENLLVLRGELDAINKAHDYIYQKLSEKYGYKR